ncbi:hypothetical protein BJF80_00100 [Serinicoccus sp. CUA-874]|nr:hypothetical protein BJF80_00100 [Serinicoccus sp. CUA-874]
MRAHAGPVDIRGPQQVFTFPDQGGGGASSPVQGRRRQLDACDRLHVPQRMDSIQQIVHRGGLVRHHGSAGQPLLHHHVDLLRGPRRATSPPASTRSQSRALSAPHAGDRDGKPRVGQVLQCGTRQQAGAVPAGWSFVHGDRQGEGGAQVEGAISQMLVGHPSDQDEVGDRPGARQVRARSRTQDGCPGARVGEQLGPGVQLEAGRVEHPPPEARLATAQGRRQERKVRSRAADQPAATSEGGWVAQRLLVSCHVSSPLSGGPGATCTGSTT